MSEPDDPDPLERILGRVAHLLPAQGPITIFIHHNLLHAFEDRPFERAVVEASQLFGCEPYLSEARYRQELARGRIRPFDLDAVLDADLGDHGAVALAPLSTTRRALRRSLLAEGLIEAQGAELAWLVSETDAIGPHSTLWQACLAIAASLPADAEPAPPPVRPRDLVLAAGGLDTDELVHPLLTRLCAAFVDQGVAYWPMPARSLGLYRAFLRIYGDPRLPPPDRWLRDLPALAGDDGAAQRSELDSIRHSLGELGIDDGDAEPFLIRTALALRGWAGLVRQLEERPDRVPVFAPPATLAGFLAVRLLLERAAFAHACRRLGLDAQPLRDRRRGLIARLPPPPPPGAVDRAWPLFQVARQLDWTAAAISALSPDDATAIAGEIRRFDGIERRRLFHLAYERRHRQEILDALSLHAPHAGSDRRPAFQAVFCIDEREESMRRHLEEVAPECETFGSAGFFGVAMYYRGIADAHPQPLCPIVIRPEHVVEEVSAEPELELHRIQRSSRRAVGQLVHGVGVGSRTFVRGTLITALGALAAIPLILRVVFPRFTARLRHHGARLIGPPRSTRLELDRRPDERPAIARHAGFTRDEMAAIVHRLLEEIGLVQRFAPVVLIIGHGSASRNNPHESAYDCGACGGRPGGPNARAFAHMANDPAVRALVAARGLEIPDDTWFVGGQHNSCTDRVELFDLDQVPGSFEPAVAAARKAFDEATPRNAHERCRRFESAPTWLPAELALAHVEARAEDLAQPRPELGHATNAICVIGRRRRTRGLFLDRRAFLVSYDPGADDERGRLLGQLLGAVVPVAAGINLEYYFGHVDPAGYGSSSKLPHNITGLVGVMDGHASDLRTGLPWQMVEIHEPVRLLLAVETTPGRLDAVLADNPPLRRLVDNRWLTVALLDPDSQRIQLCDRGKRIDHEREQNVLPVVERSVQWYRGKRHHLPTAQIRTAT